MKAKLKRRQKRLAERRKEELERVGEFARVVLANEARQREQASKRREYRERKRRASRAAHLARQ